jgi:DTW domain-containing protein YfiP
MLFPAEDASPAEEFPWRASDRPSRKWRLVLLEASWTYGKKMAHQLVELRRKLGLEPLPCVLLRGVVGQVR